MMIFASVTLKSCVDISMVGKIMHSKCHDHVCADLAINFYWALEQGT